MDNIRSWTQEDEAIIATNTDATECKRCAVELGYWKDDYIALFAKRVDRKAPEINRGYYARVKAIELFIHQFLEASTYFYVPSTVYLVPLLTIRPTNLKKQLSKQDSVASFLSPYEFPTKLLLAIRHYFLDMLILR